MPNHDLEAPENRSVRANGHSPARAPERPAQGAAYDASPGAGQAGVGPRGRAVLQLQRSHGNRYVQRVLRLARQSEESSDEARRGRGVAPDVEAAIHRKRGSGQPLDSAVRMQMEPAVGADLDGVRVHTDSEADMLNRSVSARAFTTGKDVFFRQGAYNPGSSSGRELLAHELTHVAQQSGASVQTKLEVGAPNDVFEQEADRVARGVMHGEQQPASPVTGPTGAVQRESEDEDKMQASPDPGALQRQPEEETKEEE